MSAINCFNTSCSDPAKLELITGLGCRGAFDNVSMDLNQGSISKADITKFNIPDDVATALNGLAAKCLSTPSHLLKASDSSEILRKITNVPLQKSMRNWMQDVQLNGAGKDGTQ